MTRNFCDAQRARVRTLLETRGLKGADTAEVSSPLVGGHEGPRRVRELRAEGLPIQRARLATGYWRYWLGPVPGGVQLDLLWDE